MPAVHFAGCRKLQRQGVLVEDRCGWRESFFGRNDGCMRTCSSVVVAAVCVLHVITVRMMARCRRADSMAVVGGIGVIGKELLDSLLLFYLKHDLRIGLDEALRYRIMSADCVCMDVGQQQTSVTIGKVSSSGSKA